MLLPAGQQKDCTSQTEAKGEKLSLHPTLPVLATDERPSPLPLRLLPPPPSPPPPSTLLRLSERGRGAYRLERALDPRLSRAPPLLARRGGAGTGAHASPLAAAATTAAVATAAAFAATTDGDGDGDDSNTATGLWKPQRTARQSPMWATWMFAPRTATTTAHEPLNQPTDRAIVMARRVAAAAAAPPGRDPPLPRPPPLPPPPPPPPALLSTFGKLCRNSSSSEESAAPSLNASPPLPPLSTRSTPPLLLPSLASSSAKASPRCLLQNSAHASPPCPSKTPKTEVDRDDNDDDDEQIECLSSPFSELAPSHEVECHGIFVEHLASLVLFFLSLFGVQAGRVVFQ